MGKTSVQCWGALPPATGHIRKCGEIKVAEYCYGNIDSDLPCDTPQLAGAYIKVGYRGGHQNHPSVAKVNGTWEGYQNHCKMLYPACCAAAEDGQCWLWYEYSTGLGVSTTYGFAWPNGRG